MVSPAEKRSIGSFADFEASLYVFGATFISW